MVRFAVGCVVALVASATIGCVAAVPGDGCDPMVAIAGTDGTDVLECPGPESQISVWGAMVFNEQKVTHERFRELFDLAAGPMVDVQRLALLGRDLNNGSTYVDPAATNPRPYTVMASVDWTGAGSSGRPCNRVSPATVEPHLDADDVVTARVAWTERVGENRYSYCVEPFLRVDSVTDANGDPVPMLSVIP